MAISVKNDIEYCLLRCDDNLEFFCDGFEREGKRLFLYSRGFMIGNINLKEFSLSYDEKRGNVLIYELKVISPKNENDLCLTSHEFSLLCDDFESSSFDTISLIHEENVNFVVGLMKCVKIETGIDEYCNEKIYFNLMLSKKQIIQLKEWVEWVYRESYQYYLHDEDKKGFLKLRDKILNLDEVII